MAKLNEDVKVVMLKGEKGERGEAGQGIPTGGKTGQAIIKASDNDYDYKWGSLVVDDVANATNDGNGNNIVNTYATKEELNTAKTDASKIYATKEELGDSLNFDKIYPIGSIYMSMNGTNPSTLFGGTWEQIKNGFLLSTGYTIPSPRWEYLCAENEHFTLNGDTQVRFGANGKFVTGTFHAGTYLASVDAFGSDPANGVPKHVEIYRETIYLGDAGGEDKHTLTVDEIPPHRHTQTVSLSHTPNTSYVVAEGQYQTPETPILSSETGGGQAHNNMPPYLAVYMWKRTA